LPGDIKEIAHHGERTHHRLQGDVGRHTEEHPPWRAQAHGLIEDIRGQEDVSNLWICYPLEVRENYQHE
jgi:hypothetical protein